MSKNIVNQKQFEAWLESPFTKALKDSHKAEMSRAQELLSRCENEMRYAGWAKFEADNPQRNGLYEQIRKFL